MQPSADIRQKRGHVATLAHRHRQDGLGRRRKPPPAELIWSFVSKHSDPTLLLELYYWSQEPALTKMVRAFVALPDRTRDELRAFLAAAPDLRSVSVTTHRAGRITLSLPGADQ